MAVDGLRFALAHVSWPWSDECIAVYGKFLNAYSRRPELSVEMFIDLTPGTPAIYRQEVLTRLLTVGYDIEHNLLFGSDCNADNYNATWTREWLNRDTAIFRSLEIPDSVMADIQAENLRRFLGLTPKAPARKGLSSADS